MQRWLLGAGDADRMEDALASAGAIVTSDLTTAEVGRTLDAIHLATALLHAAEIGAPILLSVDRQIRANAQAFGLALAP